MNSPNIIYPEMLEYAWIKDFDRVKAASKFVSGSPETKQEQMVPIDLLLTVMTEAASRPEVLAAYASSTTKQQIPPREQHLLMWHNEYLRHKYGTRPDPVGEMTISMRKLANGVYAGLDDPKLIVDLLARPFVFDPKAH